MDNIRKKIRKQIRFIPDIPSYALIDINNSNNSFNAQYAGLVIDESHGGCCLAVLSQDAACLFLHIIAQEERARVVSIPPAPCCEA